MKRNYTNPAIEAVPFHQNSPPLAGSNENGINAPISGYQSSSAMLTPTADVNSLALAYPGQDDWEETDLSVALNEETSDGVYVALFPYSPTDYMHFTVTGSSGTYTGMATATLKDGRYYPVTLILTKKQK